MPASVADGRGSRLDLLQVDCASPLRRGEAQRPCRPRRRASSASFSPRTFSNIASRSGTSRPLRCSPETSSTTWPWCSITVRSPTSSAWRMLWVTIMVVSFFSATIRAVRCRTKSAVRGSSAAVCSSSNRMRDGCSAAISRLTAWRWPPESRPMRSPRRFSRPRPRVARLSRKPSRIDACTALPRPRPVPRRCARAMFSSMVRSSQVPAMGSWNTRATRLARAQTGLRVTSSSSIRICPLSIGRSPDTALRKVDLPAPLEPITVTNWPAGMSSDRPRRARVSMGVPGLKVIFRFFALSMVRLPSCRAGVSSSSESPGRW